MLFGKKKKLDPISVDEVKKMAANGLSDREIIKDFKGRGYSYEDIEKSMLAAVKDNVEAKQEFEFAGAPEEFYAPPASQPPQYEPPAIEEEEFDPSAGEAVLEELVEGVIEEKWHKFENRVTKMEDTFDKIRSEIKDFESRVDQQRQASPMKEMDARFSELSQQLDDLDARVGGLEKAFKQFLPSLTKNVESLSQLIHEIKEKHHVMEEEV